MFGHGHGGHRRGRSSTTERMAAVMVQRIVRGFIGRRRSGHRRAGCRRPAPCGYGRDYCHAPPPNHYRAPAYGCGGRRGGGHGYGGHGGGGGGGHGHGHGHGGGGHGHGHGH